MLWPHLYAKKTISYQRQGTNWLQVIFLNAGLMREFGHEVASVAVLTPYKAQLALLKSTFAGQHLKTALANVEFATVDGFQVSQADKRI